MKRVVLVLFGLLILDVKSNASHILGGDFFYKHIGGDKYSVSLIMYTDTSNNAKSLIQKHIVLNLFDGKTKELIDTFMVKLKGSERFNNKIYKCLKPNKFTDIVKYEYFTILNLPKKEGGYYVVNQSCCRNLNLINVMDPSGTGITYWFKIADKNLNNKFNSSPQFKTLPINYACVNAPLKYLHYATDNDNDILEYELYTPFRGASRDDNFPLLNTKPPYEGFNWSNDYDFNYPIDADPKLEINKNTGQVFAVPNRIGNYAVGIKVKEYRDDKLIGETYRDFQINVIKCDFNLTSNFVITDSNHKVIINNQSCNNTIYLKNYSVGSKSYLWDFGDLSSIKDTSTLKNPKWTYNKPGIYKIILKTKNELCDDQFELKVNVIDKSFISLGPDVVLCNKATKILKVLNRNYDTIVWNNHIFKDSIIISKSSVNWVKIVYGKCVLTDSINVLSDSVKSKISKRDSMFCDKVDIQVRVFDYYPKSTFKWSNSTINFLDSNRFSDIGSYTVSTISRLGCIKTDILNFSLANLNPQLGLDTFFCDEVKLSLDPKEKNGKRYLWQDGSTGSILKTTQFGTYWVKVFNKHCSKSDTIQILKSNLNLNLGENEHFCDSAHLVLDAGKQFDKFKTYYLWSDLSNLQTLKVNKAGTYSVLKSNSLGCTQSDTIVISVSNSPKINLGKDTIVCHYDNFKLSVKGEFNQYLWYDGKKDKVNISNSEGVKYVTVTDKFGCKGSDTINVNYNPDASPNQYYIANVFTPNADQLNDFFPFEINKLPQLYHFTVYNRWGQKIFESTPNAPFWDGTYMGKMAPVETYFWTLSFKACNTSIKNQKGTVMVLK